MPRPDVLARQVVDALAATTLTYTDEVALHQDMARALSDAGIDHQREVQLDRASRIDFLTVDGIGIEVKVAGSLQAVTRQMLRYAHHDQVRALVLVTTRARHHGVPTALNEKPVELYSLIGQAL